MIPFTVVIQNDVVAVHSDVFDMDTPEGKRTVAVLCRKIARDLDPYNTVRPEKVRT